MVLGLKPMGKSTTLKKNYKFWTEPRYCMVFGLKSIGKSTTLKKNYKFWTEPRYCMVLGLKRMEKLVTRKWLKSQTEWKSRAVLGSLALRKLT